MKNKYNDSKFTFGVNNQYFIVESKYKEFNRSLLRLFKNMLNERPKRLMNSMINNDGTIIRICMDIIIYKFACDGFVI